MSASVDPIPKDASLVMPHLVVRDAAGAIDFYAKAFGAEGVFRMPGPDGERLVHAEIRIDGGAVMLAEEVPEAGIRSPQSLEGTPITLHLYVADCDGVVARAAAAGCTVTMPPTDMFWGDRYARLSDPFGHSWSVAAHRRDGPAEEMRDGMLAAFFGSENTARSNA